MDIASFGPVRHHSGMGEQLFARRLRGAREAAGLSRDRLAALCGETLSNLYNWEAGGRFPRREESLRNVAEVLGTSTDYLLGVVDDPRPASARADLGELLEVEDLEGAIDRALEALREAGGRNGQAGLDVAHLTAAAEILRRSRASGA